MNRNSNNMSTGMALLLTIQRFYDILCNNKREGCDEDV